MAAKRFTPAERPIPIFEALDSRLLLSANDPLQDAFADLAAAGGNGGGGGKPVVNRDDYGNSLTAANKVTLNSTGALTVSGKFEVAGDVDFFKFTATITGTMTVTMGGSTPLVPLLTVYNASKTVVLGTSTSATFAVVAGQQFYVKAAAANNVTGNWSVDVSTTVPLPPDPVPPDWMPGAKEDSAAGGAVTAIPQTTAGRTVLVVQGTANGDTITISQTPSGMRVNGALVANTSSVSGVALYGFGGADWLRLDASVTVVSVLYGGGDNDQVFDNGPGVGYLYGEDGADLLVTVGGGADFLYGGAGADSFWADSTDTLVDVDNVAETAAKSVHVITAFARPTTKSNVSLEIAGQDMIDPSARYAYTNNFVKAPLFANGPKYNDIFQGQVGDCYFLAGLASLAQSDPGLVVQSVTALGDGTYAVRFFSGIGGPEKYYRVDAQLPTSGSRPGYAGLTRNGGGLWVALLEKAFAQFRSGQNSYASINGGWMNEAYTAITAASYTSISTTGTGVTADGLAKTMSDALGAGNAVSAGNVSGDADPIYNSHAYMVQSVTRIDGVWYVTVYNPWGQDVDYRFTPPDSNNSDGLITLTAAQFLDSFTTVETCLI